MMKEKGKAYYLINIVVLLICVSLLCWYIYQNIGNIHLSILEVITYASLFIILNIIKYFRQYLIFLEEKIPLERYTKLYIKTTFVNIMLPFKLGDIFKMYCFGKEIHNYKKGIIGILLDRFIDTVILLILLIPMEIISIGYLSTITILLLSFVISVLLFVIIVPSTYKYLNSFFIISRQTKSTLTNLKILEGIHNIYESGMQLLKGRAYLLAILSIFSWVIDFLLIKIISIFRLGKFDISIFIDYLTSAVYQPNNIVLMLYSIIAAIIFGIMIVAVYGVTYVKKLDK